MFSTHQQFYVTYSEVLHVLVRVGEWLCARVGDPTKKLLHRIVYSVRLIAGGSPSLFPLFKTPISVTPELNSPFFYSNAPLLQNHLYFRFSTFSTFNVYTVKVLDSTPWQ